MLGASQVVRTIKAGAAAAVVCVVTGAPLALAANTDPGKHSMMSKMKPEEWYPFVAGMVEGVAFHRFAAGNKDTAGMNCIYDWFYKDEGTLDNIYSTLGKYPDYPPAAVVAALAKRKCGGE